MPLGEEGTAGVVPAIEHERLAHHLARAAIRLAVEPDIVDERSMQVLGNNIRVYGCIEHVLSAAGAVVVSALLADPHGKRSSPEALTRDGPVLDVAQPFTEPSLANPFRCPFHLVIELEQLLLHGGHAHEPAVHGVVEQRVAGAPAVRVVVGVHLLAVEQVVVVQQVDDVVIAVLHVSAIE